MEPSLRTPRTPSRLSDSVHHQLCAYALAATTAGVGLLALTGPADARIVYTKTDANVFSKQGYPLDLNNDGITDFRFLGRSAGTDCAFSLALSIDQGASANKIRQKSWGAAALAAGVVVGPKGPFSGNLLMGSIASACSGPMYQGPWENGGKGVKNRYLGLRFEIRGKTHYGWARLNFPDPSNAAMTGYAYETVANKPIITGKTKGPDVTTVQPASLGRLAAGASAIPAWRSVK
jgi:hypothetical protein